MIPRIARHSQLPRWCDCQQIRPTWARESPVFSNPWKLGLSTSFRLHCQMIWLPQSCLTCQWGLSVCLLICFTLKFAGIKMGRGNLLRVARCEYYNHISIDKCLCQDSHALQAGQISGLACLTFVSWTLLPVCGCSLCMTCTEHRGLLCVLPLKVLHMPTDLQGSITGLLLISSRFPVSS